VHRRPGRRRAGPGVHAAGPGVRHGPGRAGRGRAGRPPRGRHRHRGTTGRPAAGGVVASRLDKAAGGERAYPYRYEGFRLLLASGGRLFLVTPGRRPGRDRTIVLPCKDVRVRLVAQSQGTAKRRPPRRPAPLGRVRKVPSSARRAGPAASGACSRRAGRSPSYWMYLGLRPARRECVPGVAGQTGLCGHGLGARGTAHPATTPPHPQDTRTPARGAGNGATDHNAAAPARPRY
jgi:hypothetical protein